MLGRSSIIDGKSMERIGHGVISSTKVGIPCGHKKSFFREECFRSFYTVSYHVYSAICNKRLREICQDIDEFIILSTLCSVMVESPQVCTYKIMNILHYII
jgi:hypothetical protein